MYSKRPSISRSGCGTSQQLSPTAPHRGGNQTVHTHTLGTPTPIDPPFSSLFSGKSLEDIARWLRGKPQTVNLDDTFFGVLDKQVEKSGKIAICRLNDPKVEEEVAWCILRPAGGSSVYLAGLDSCTDWKNVFWMGSIPWSFEFQGDPKHFGSFLVAALLS